MRKKEKQVYIVPGRECGECTACCINFTIDSPELVKLPNIACENLLECGGCSIYDNRPDVCNKWFCAWRNLQELDNSWRPDKNGIILEFSEENFPGVFAGRIGFKFTVIDKEKPFRNRKFINFVEKQLKNNVPCILSYGNKPSELPAVAFLNFALHHAVASGNKNAIKKELLKVMDACEKQPIEKLAIVNGKIVEVS